MTGYIPLFPGLPGGPEVLLILLVAILLFGANKIPKLARSTGQAMGEFKKGRQEIEEELQDMGEEPATSEADTGPAEPTEEPNPTPDADATETDQ